MVLRVAHSSPVICLFADRICADVRIAMVEVRWVHVLLVGVPRLYLPYPDVCIYDYMAFDFLS